MIRIALVSWLCLVATCFAKPPLSPKMLVAQEVAGQLMRDWLAFTAPEELAVLEGARKHEITVIDGNMDHLHWLLDSAKIPYTLIPNGALDPTIVPGRHIVMVNCPGVVAHDHEADIAAFVKRGGWLLTTDWALRVVEKGFPGYVKWAEEGGNKIVTGDEVVPVKLHDDLHPLVRGVMGADSAAHWWLEGSSYPIQIEKPDQVRVLIYSPEMKRKYQHDAVAVHFEFGLGTVFHLTSHVAAQRVDTGSAGTAAQYVLGSLAGTEISHDAAARAVAKLDGVTRGELESAYTITKFLARIVIENRARE